MHTRLWAEVSRRAITDNARQLRTTCASPGPMGVLKANAYGHGLVPVALAALEGGLLTLAVATVDEGCQLRQAGVTVPIYLLAPLVPDDAAAVVACHLTPFVSSTAFWDAYTQAAKALPEPAPAVLALDTGMGREGFVPEEALALLAALPPSLEVIGFSTHFASADEDDLSFTEHQSARFDSVLSRAGDGAARRFRSRANSPALLRLPQVELGRAGLLLYGIAPYPGALTALAVQPALSLRARLTLVKTLPAGTTIGYGRTHTLARVSRVGTVPAGYGDGWLRGLSGRGAVLVRGRRCPILGRVSMDQCQIDLTDLDETVAVGEPVTLIGEDNGAAITAAEVAAWAGTTPHEPTTALSPRVPRIYI